MYQTASSTETGLLCLYVCNAHAGAWGTLARRKSGGNSRLRGEEGSSLEFEGLHKALFALLDSRRQNFEMLATGEGKYLQQTDS